MLYYNSNLLKYLYILLLSFLPIFLFACYLFILTIHNEATKYFLLNDDSLSLPLMLRDLYSGNFSFFLWNDYNQTLFYPDIIIYGLVNKILAYNEFLTSLFYPIAIFCIQIYLLFFIFKNQYKYILFLIIISLLLSLSILVYYLNDHEMLTIGSLKSNNPIVWLFMHNHTGNLLNMSFAYILYSHKSFQIRYSLTQLTFLIHVGLAIYSNLFFLIHFSLPIIILEFYYLTKGMNRNNSIIYLLLCFFIGWILSNGMLVNYPSTKINVIGFFDNAYLLIQYNLSLMILICLNISIYIYYKKNLNFLLCYNLLVLSLCILFNKYLPKYLLPVYFVNIFLICNTLSMKNYFNLKKIKSLMIFILFVFISFIFIMTISMYKTASVRLLNYTPSYVECIKNFKIKNDLNNGISSYGFSKKFTFFGDGSYIVDFTKYLSPWFWGNNTNWYLNKKFDYIIDFIPHNKTVEPYTFHQPNIKSILGKKYKKQVFKCNDLSLIGYFVDFNIMENKNLKKSINQHLNVTFFDRLKENTFFIKMMISKYLNLKHFFVKTYLNLKYYVVRINKKLNQDSYNVLDLLKEIVKRIFI